MPKEPNTTIFALGCNAFGQCGEPIVKMFSLRPNLLLSSSSVSGFSVTWESTVAWGFTTNSEAVLTQNWMIVWGRDALRCRNRDSSSIPTVYDLPEEIQRIQELKTIRGRGAIVVLDRTRKVWLVETQGASPNSHHAEPSLSCLTTTPSVAGLKLVGREILSSVIAVGVSGERLITLSDNHTISLWAFPSNDFTKQHHTSSSSAFEILRTFSPRIMGISVGPNHALFQADNPFRTPLSLRTGPVGGLHGQLGHGAVDSSPYEPSADDLAEIEALSGIPMKSCAAGGLHSVWLDESGELYASGMNGFGQSGRLQMRRWWVERDGLDREELVHGTELNDRQEKENTTAECCNIVQLRQREDIPVSFDATIPSLFSTPKSEPVDLLACGEHVTVVSLVSDRENSTPRIWLRGMLWRVAEEITVDTWKEIIVGDSRGEVTRIDVGEGTAWHVVVGVKDIGE
ncbi:RCC1 domain-containing protein 1 [Gonapodya sp. JEL0774]|nr:RCC1 domain-containing protein 1 [Gonapodya sp. JEL0774]